MYAASVQSNACPIHKGLLQALIELQNACHTNLPFLKSSSNHSCSCILHRILIEVTLSVKRTFHSTSKYLNIEYWISKIECVSSWIHNYIEYCENRWNRNFICMSRGNQKKQVILLLRSFLPPPPPSALNISFATANFSDNNRKRKEKKLTPEKKDRNESSSNRMCVIGVYQYIKWSKQPSSNMSHDHPITNEPTTDGILIIKDSFYYCVWF